MGHVFISYSRADSVYAGQLTEDLRQRGFDVWMDTSALEPSSYWWREIERGIEDCAAFVLLISPNSNASNWVYREVSLAIHLEKTFFPLQLATSEDSSLMFSMLLGVQWEDVCDGRLPSEKFFRQLAHVSEPKLAQAGKAVAPIPVLEDIIGESQPEAADSADVEPEQTADLLGTLAGMDGESEPVALADLLDQSSEHVLEEAAAGAQSKAALDDRLPRSTTTRPTRTPRKRSSVSGKVVRGGFRLGCVVFALIGFLVVLLVALVLFILSDMVSFITVTRRTATPPPAESRVLDGQPVSLFDLPGIPFEIR